MIITRRKALIFLGILPVTVGCSGSGPDQTLPATRASRSDGAGGPTAIRAGPEHATPLEEFVTNLRRAPSLGLYGEYLLLGEIGQVRRVLRTGGLPNVLVDDETMKNSDEPLTVDRLVVSDSMLLIGAGNGPSYYRVVRFSLLTGSHEIIGHIERGSLLVAVSGTGYCAQNASVLCSFPMTGRTIRPIRWNCEPSSAISDTSYVFIADRRSKSVLRYDVSTHSFDVLLSGIAYDALLAQDETNIYVSSGGAVRRLAKNGNPPVTVIYTGQKPRVIVASGDTVFVLDGAIKAVQNVGGAPRTLASETDIGHVAGAIADGRFLYVAATKDDGSGVVYRIDYSS